MLFFIIRLFAGWRYAGRIFNAGICRGKAISEFRSPKALPLHPPPSWARKEFCVVVCAALLTFVCMLRYSEWNVVPIWFLYSSVLMVVRCADLVPVFFDTYRNILYQSDISGQDAQSASVPCSVFFLSVGSVSQRKVASGRAAAEEG